MAAKKRKIKLDWEAILKAIRHEMECLGEFDRHLHKGTVKLFVNGQHVRFGEISMIVKIADEKPETDFTTYKPGGWMTECSASHV